MCSARFHLSHIGTVSPQDGTLRTSHYTLWSCYWSCISAWTSAWTTAHGRESGHNPWDLLFHVWLQINTEFHFVFLLKDAFTIVRWELGLRGLRNIRPHLITTLKAICVSFGMRSPALEWWSSCLCLFSDEIKVLKHHACLVWGQFRQQTL